MGPVIDLSGESGGVWDQGPGVALGLGLFEDICQAIEPARHREGSGESGGEGIPVLVVPEDLCSIYSAGHDVVEEAGGV